MPEAQLTEPLADAAEKGGFKEEMFAALKSAVEADVDAFLRRGSVNAQGLRDAPADGSPPRARHGDPGGRSGWAQRS